MKNEEDNDTVLKSWVMKVISIADVFFIFGN